MRKIVIVLIILFQIIGLLLIINNIMKPVLILGLLIFGITAVELESGEPSTAWVYQMKVD